jgi:STE24 endopeptidase
MSEITAIRISTVSPVSRISTLRSAAAMLGVAAGAGFAARLLGPRRVPPPAPPAPLEEHFSPQEIARARAFARPQRAIGLAGTAVDAGLLLLLTRYPPRALDRVRPAPAGGALAGGALALGLSAAGLPLSVVARRRALAAGLATQSWRGWAQDVAKGIALNAAALAGVGCGVLSAAERWPRGWWLVAAGGSAGATAVLTGLAPVVLDPIFNEFQPLPDGPVRRDVLELAAAAGVRVGQVLSVDASRRTTAANAYVAGVGPTKRVVLFDTLLDRCSREEVRVVVAHELAHVRGRDVLRGLCLSALLAPAVGAAAASITGTLTGEAELTPSRLPALVLACGVAMTPAAPIAAALSRRLERRADELSLTLGGDVPAFISFERRIAVQNLADLDPPRWAVLLASHPPTAERIGHALRAAAA